MAPDFFTTIDHVQLAMPPGGEGPARRFYRDLLGMDEVAKPAELVKRGGCWFKSGEVQIHLGVEQKFRRRRLIRPCDAMTTPLWLSVCTKLAWTYSK
jgi:hypothetical protein